MDPSSDRFSDEYRHLVAFLVNQIGSALFTTRVLSLRLVIAVVLAALLLWLLISGGYTQQEDEPYV